MLKFNLIINSLPCLLMNSSLRASFLSRPFQAGLLSLLLLLGSLTAQAQTTRFVSNTGTNSNPASATSWATSTTDLQGAVNSLSATGGEVWVATGVYKPTTTSLDSRIANFSMRNGVAIYGGLAGNELVGYNMALRNLSANQTILSGEIGDPTSTTDNSYNVIYNPFSLNLTASAVLDGFVVTGGMPMALWGLAPLPRAGGYITATAIPR